MHIETLIIYYQECVVHWSDDWHKIVEKSFSPLTFMKINVSRSDTLEAQVIYCMTSESTMIYYCTEILLSSI